MHGPEALSSVQMPVPFSTKGNPVARAHIQEASAPLLATHVSGSGVMLPKLARRPQGSVSLPFQKQLFCISYTASYLFLKIMQAWMTKILLMKLKSLNALG